MLFTGLLLSLFLEYVSPGAFIPVISATKIGTIIPLTIFAFAVFQLRPISNKILLKQKNSKLILFFLFIVTLSVPFSDVTLYSWTIFKVVLGYVLWYVMIVKLVTDLDKLKKVFVVLLLSHILLLALNPDVVLDPASRSYLRGAPFLGDGNDFSLSVCVLLPICLWLFLDTKKAKYKAIYATCLIVLVLAVVGTQSRGGSLALIGTVGFLWWSYRRKAVGLILVAVVAVGVISFAPPEYFQRMQSISNYEEEGSAMGRIMAWKSGVRMARKYPLTGVGTGHFPVALGTEFRPPEFGEENLPWLTAHSMYFLILGELGIPGILCLMAILIGNYRRLIHLRNMAKGLPGCANYAQLFLMLNASLVAFCIGGAFLSVAYYPHIFVLSGLIVSATLMFESHVESIGEVSREDA